jgi:hypothetical protein
MLKAAASHIENEDKMTEHTDTLINLNTSAIIRKILVRKIFCIVMLFKQGY